METQKNHCLLIVPYGIETFFSFRFFFCFPLLVVPYGIETHCKAVQTLYLFLLIVPYGIETTV